MTNLFPAVFDALGDATRVEIVSRLASKGKQSTLNLLDGLAMSRQAATRHLTVLESAGLVKQSRQGREIFRELNSNLLDDAAAWLARTAMAWDDQATPLDNFLGEGE